MVKRKPIILIGFTLLLCTCVSERYALYHDPPSATFAPIGTELAILSWNIGFAGLGENAEFIADGGKKIIPSSKADVRRNLEGIKTTIAREQPDLLLIQEMALPSNVNRFLDVYAEVRQALPAYWAAYSPKVELNFLCISDSIGQSILSRSPPGDLFRMELPAEQKSTLGIKQKHHLLVARFPTARSGKQLVLANVHLSAFDEAAVTRYRQLKAIEDFIIEEYSKGSYIVCGGDWNLLLEELVRFHTTPAKYLFWVYKLPAWFPPGGWIKAIDPETPTVRTLERPYRKSENYTGIIDGFILSSNVELVEVRTIDTGFLFSDHQPVLIKIRLKNAPE